MTSSPTPFSACAGINRTILGIHDDLHDAGASHVAAFPEGSSHVVFYTLTGLAYQCSREKFVALFHPHNPERSLDTQTKGWSLHVAHASKSSTPCATSQLPINALNHIVFLNIQPDNNNRLAGRMFLEALDPKSRAHVDDALTKLANMGQIPAWTSSDFYTGSPTSPHN